MNRKIRYKRTRVKVEVPDDIELKCQVAGCNSGRGKGLHFHHLKYEFSTQEVRKNPQLALKNTQILCYYHHRIANALRIVEENPEIIEKLKSI